MVLSTADGAICFAGKQSRMCVRGQEPPCYSHVVFSLPVAFLNLFSFALLTCNGFLFLVFLSASKTFNNPSSPFDRFVVGRRGTAHVFGEEGSRLLATFAPDSPSEVREFKGSGALAQGFLCVCLRACVLACVHACVRACLRALVL